MKNCFFAYRFLLPVGIGIGLLTNTYHFYGMESHSDHLFPSVHNAVNPQFCISLNKEKNSIAISSKAAPFAFLWMIQEYPENILMKYNVNESTNTVVIDLGYFDTLFSQMNYTPNTIPAHLKLLNNNLTDTQAIYLTHLLKLQKPAAFPHNSAHTKSTYEKLSTHENHDTFIYFVQSMVVTVFRVPLTRHNDPCHGALDEKLQLQKKLKMAQKAVEDLKSSSEKEHSAWKAFSTKQTRNLHYLYNNHITSAKQWLTIAKKRMIILQSREDCSSVEPLISKWNAFKEIIEKISTIFDNVSLPDSTPFRYEDIEQYNILMYGKFPFLVKLKEEGDALLNEIQQLEKDFLEKQESEIIVLKRTKSEEVQTAELMKKELTQRITQLEQSTTQLKNESHRVRNSIIENANKFDQLKKDKELFEQDARTALCNIIKTLHALNERCSPVSAQRYIYEQENNTQSKMPTVEELSTRVHSEIEIVAHYIDTLPTLNNNIERNDQKLKNEQKNQINEQQFTALLICMAYSINEAHKKRFNEAAVLQKKVIPADTQPKSNKKGASLGSPFFHWTTLLIGTEACVIAALFSYIAFLHQRATVHSTMK